MTKLNVKTMHQLAMTRLLEYAACVLSEDCELSNLERISPEVEAYRKYFLELNGENCSLYRLALLLLVLGNLPRPEQSEMNKLKDYVQHYTVYRSFVEEIMFIKSQLSPN